MKITEDVPTYTGGMEAKSKEFVGRGAEVYAKV
jgi:hypothetical protein